ncbi:MAG: aldose 1-epimerase family protein [Cardiobacteriaceae bacterium]|nr:aldose 1-epimerase family protein [Cardiobacteriaceae bacterium]
MYRLENDFIAVTVAPHGAELHSLTSGGHEYLWQGDPNYWGRRSPILFPIVGKLKNGSYQYHNHTYKLPQHGFARDQHFRLIEHSENELQFSLEDSGESGEHYPFAFILNIHYTLHGDTLRITWHVHNPSAQELLFSIGAHPAFNLPLIADENFEDHSITLEGTEISQLGWRDGLLDPTPHAAETHIPLHYNLFAHDALIYHTPNPTSVILRGKASAPCIAVHYRDLPYLGLWTPADKQAPFICIEPWAGVMDCAEHDGQLENKLGIQHLAPHADWRRYYDIQIQGASQA